jgi:hypothetical protein
MVRDEAKREKCSQAGKKGGGSPALKNAGDTGSDARKIGTFKGHPKGGSKGHPKGGSKPPEARGQITSPSEKSGSVDPAAGEPLKPDKNAEAKGKKKDTNANHHPAIRAFCEAWQVKFGKKYPFAGGKDADAVAVVLAAVDNDLCRFEGLVERYLASTDKFIVGNGFGLGTLRLRLPELVASEPSAPPDERESLRQELFDLVRKEAITLEEAEHQFGGLLHDRAAA